MILDNIHNHYEKLVYDEVLAFQAKKAHRLLRRCWKMWSVLP